MPRTKQTAADQLSLLEAKSSAPRPACRRIREAVAAWREDGYKGVTAHHATLLNYWFKTDHRLPNGRIFAYHYAQREAIETLIYLYEVAKVRRQKDLVETLRHAAPTCACCNTTTSPATASRWRPAAARPKSWRWPSPGSSSTPLPKAATTTPDVPDPRAERHRLRAPAHRLRRRAHLPHRSRHPAGTLRSSGTSTATCAARASAPVRRARCT